MEIILSQELTTPAQDQLVVDVKTALVDTKLLGEALADSAVPTKITDLENDLISVLTNAEIDTMTD